MYKLALTITIVSLTVTSALASTIYVNGATGNDAWTGLCTEWDGGTCGPKRTLQAGLDAASGGCQVIIADGMYAGDGNRDLDFSGKALTLRSASGNPEHCIVDCEHVGRGFYFHCHETASTVVNGLTIRNGISGCGGSGGGVYCYNSSPLLTNCIITANSSYAGGGVYCWNSNAVLTNCVITGNTSWDRGGALYCDGSNPRLTNCTITGNAAASDGGAVYCTSSSPRLTNCILWADTPAELYTTSGSGPVVSYSDIQFGWTGTGNIADAPGFAFPGDCHLPSDSPCIDAASDALSVGLPTADIEGQPRRMDGDGDGLAVIDMGAYECNPAVPIVAVSATEFTFSVPPGQTGSQNLAIRNAGYGTMTWELAWQADWLSAAPTTGEASGEPDVVTLTVNTQNLTHGRYNALLNVLDAYAVNSPRPVWIVLYVAGAVSVPSEHATIQSAIDAALPGDEVVLADGVYTGPANRDLDFHGKPLTLRSASGDPSACIIDCEREGRGLFFCWGDTATTVVDGITITGGGTTYDSSGLGYGAGVYFLNSSPALHNCVISRNLVEWRGIHAPDAYGGGVSCVNSCPSLTDCTITENAIHHGVEDDYAHGGGIAWDRSSNPTLLNCTIARNHAGYGGGISCNGRSASVLIGCRIWDNTATVGGGIHLIGDPVVPVDLTLVNCTIAHNWAHHVGGAIQGDCAPALTLTDCILWDDVPHEIYGEGVICDMFCCDVQGGWPGEGNIEADPQFTFDGHLTAESPCRDAGCPTPATGQLDLDGEPRIAGWQVDIGADEFIDGDEDSLPDWWEARYFPDATGADPAADPDYDGLTNAQEYPRGTDPLVPPRSYYVDPAGNDAWDGLAPQFNGLHGPKLSAQAAIDACQPYDRVVLADAVHTGPGNRALTTSGKPLEIRSASGDPARCTLDCQAAGRGFYFRSRETTETVVRGLTITNGHGDMLGQTDYAFGAGVACRYGSDPLLIDCRICGNVTAGDFSMGAGVYCSESSPTLMRCSIDHNVSGGNAAGVAFAADEGSPALLNCRLVDNAATVGLFGAVYCTRSITLRNCTIAGNLGSWNPDGGIYCEGSECAPRLVNCIIWGNSGRQVYARDYAAPALSYCDVAGGWSGTGNIALDPLFADAAAGDYHLARGSPCIDAGDPEYVCTQGETDLDGYARQWDGDHDGVARPDMGAYEFAAHRYGDLNCDDAVNVFDIDAFVLAMTDPPGYATAFPECARSLADTNADGAVNVFDIDPFVRILTAG